MKDHGNTLDPRVTPADFHGKLRKFYDSLDLYAHCYRIGEVSTDRVKQVAYCLLESVMNFYDVPAPRFKCVAFMCAICEGVLRQPTTTPCGHTFCKNCVLNDASRACKKCDQKLNFDGPLETNILVKCLVEKFWPSELAVAELRNEGIEMLQKNQLDLALEKFNKALNIDANDAVAYLYKSQTLYRLGKFQPALEEAEKVIKLRPNWGKGYLQKGHASLAMGSYGVALAAFCIFVALEKNPQQIRHDICKILDFLLSDKLSRRLHSASPFGSSPHSRLRRARYFHRSAMIRRNDVEGDSSGDEDFSDASISSLTDRSNFYLIIEQIFGELEKLKENDHKSLDLKLEPGLIEKSDFDCVLCFRTLWKPVTTPCGHSYCLVCLDRSLDYSSSCPLCMKNLTDYLAVTPKNTTEFLNKALKDLFPEEYRLRQMVHEAEMLELAASHEKETPRIPVFICTTAYPSIHCPLFIYEPRYRLMVRRCVEAGTRQFGIAACFSSENGSKRYADFGTILEIKDWVLMSDGCSILSTVGVRRFRILSRSERDGYDTAGIEFLVDKPVSQTNLLSLSKLHDKVRNKALSWIQTFSKDFQEQIVSSFGTIPDVEDNWLSLPDGPSWTWWLLTILPLGPQLQVSILGTTSLEKRLRAIDKALDQIQDRLQPQQTCARSVPAEDSHSRATTPRTDVFPLPTACPFRRL